MILLFQGRFLVTVYIIKFQIRKGFVNYIFIVYFSSQHVRGLLKQVLNVRYVDLSYTNVTADGFKGTYDKKAENS